MGKHLSSATWCTRITDTLPYQTVKTVDNNRVNIAFFPGNSGNGLGFIISRKDARLLAKRINSCLDHSTSKAPPLGSK